SGSRTVLRAKGHAGHAESGADGGAGLVHHERAGEPAGVLDDDGVGAVADDALKQRLKAWASVDGICAAHSLIVELAHELEAGVPGKRLDCPALAFVAVLVRPEIGGRAGAEIGQRGYQFLPAHCLGIPGDSRYICHYYSRKSDIFGPESQREMGSNWR